MEPLLPQISTNLPIYISMILCSMAAMIVTLFILPLQFEQAGVQNGLAKLRKQLLAYGMTTLIATSIASYFLANVSVRLLASGEYVSTTSQILLLVFSISKFLIAYIGHQIYHQQYVLKHED